MKNGFRYSSSNFLNPVGGFFCFSYSGTNCYNERDWDLSLLRQPVMKEGMIAPNMMVVMKTINMTELCIILI